MSAQRKCRVCGCPDDRACVTPAGPCSWVEPDLCSGCVKRILDVPAELMEAIENDVLFFRLGGGEGLLLTMLIEFALTNPTAPSEVREFGLELRGHLIDRLNASGQAQPEGLILNR